MERHRHGKENQPTLNNGQTNSDGTEPTTSEKQLKEKRKYFNRTYQEMSQEKKQVLLLKNRVKKQQRTGKSSNYPIQSAIATSSIPTNSETSLPMTNNRSTTSYEATGPSRNQASASTPLNVRFDGASVIDPNRASRSSHGVQTCRKMVYSRANNQPPVLIQQNGSTNKFDNITEDNFDDSECSYNASSYDNSDHYANTSDPFDFVYQDLPSTQSLLKEPTYFMFCGAKKFQYKIRTFCCMNGKARLASSSVPDALYYLFTTNDKISVEFRHHIRSYNTHFSFTSFGVKDAKRKKNTNHGVGLTNENSNCRGVYNFRVHGQIYHFIDQLVPREGRIPEYLQLYFFDMESELDHRLQRIPSLDKEIVAKLMIIISANPYNRVFRSLGELRTLDTSGITLNTSADLDQRVYNKPTTSQVAAVWVEGNGDNSAFRRSIVVFGRSFRSSIVNYHFGCYDLLAYPLFISNGEVGWHPKIPRVGVSMASITDEDDGDEAEQGN